MNVKSILKLTLAIFLFLLSATTITLNVVLNLEPIMEIVLSAFSIFTGASATLSFTQSITIKNQNHDRKKIHITGDASVGDITTYQSGDSATYYINTENKKTTEVLEKLAESVDKLSEENISKVIKHIDEKLSHEIQVINMPNNDFLVKFIEEAKKISNDEIQKVWSSLFVHETKNPNTITIRTLDTLKNMSVSEAKLFEKISANSIIIKGNIGYIPIEISKNIPLVDLTKLADIGLLKSNLNLTWSPRISASSEIPILNKNKVILIKNNTPNEYTLKIPARVYTDVGLQLVESLNISANDQIFTDFALHLRSTNPSLVVSLHEVNSISINGNISYQRIDLLPPLSK